MSSSLSPAPDRVLERLTAEPTAGRLLAAATVELVGLLDASACVLSRLVGDVLVEIAEHSRTGSTLQLGHGYVLGDYPLTREVVESGQPRTASLFDDRADAAEAELLRELGFTSLLMLALPGETGPWGLVELYATDARTWTAADSATGERVVAGVSELLAALER